MKRDYQLFPPETQGKIDQWRLKVANKTITLEEMKEGIAILRSDRQTAVTQTAASGRKPRQPKAAKALVPQRTTASLLAGFLVPKKEGKTE